MTAAHAPTVVLGAVNQNQMSDARMVPYEPGRELSLNKAASDGFPSDKVFPYDPINHKKYQHVMVGPSFKSRNPLGDYDYWRYVTVYNGQTQTERVAYLPYFEEDCHDFSIFMAQWDETRHFKVTISTSVGAEKLGLSTSVSMSLEAGVSFTATRRIQAVRGVQAKHYPYKVSEKWIGVTFIQTYSVEQGGYGYLLPSRWESMRDSYPYEFHLDNQNVGFKVSREVSKYCENYDPDKDPTRTSTIYLPER